MARRGRLLVVDTVFGSGKASEVCGSGFWRVHMPECVLIARPRCVGR
jgi:hypothetical protein